MMTLQEIFDRVVTHLLTQNERCVSGSGACRYRHETAEGKVLRCAVGCLLTDEAYSKEMECLPFDIYPQSYANCGVDVKDYHVNKMLTRLQTIHDEHSPVEWYRDLERLAVSFRLKFNPPKLESQVSPC